MNAARHDGHIASTRGDTTAARLAESTGYIWNRYEVPRHFRPIDEAST